MKWHQRIFVAGIDTVRPFLGFMNIVCIYEVSCTDYAKHQLTNKSLYIALPTITLRLLSCNPLTALVRRYRSKDNAYK